MDRQIIKLGYLNPNNIYDIEDQNLRALSHINLAFAKVVSTDGTVNFQIDDEQKYFKFREQNVDIKIMLAIGGWGAGNFSEAASNSDSREKFVKTTLDIISKYNLDGVDLDWEYPCSSSAGISSSSADKVNFTLLLKALRSSFDKLSITNNKQYLLTFAAGASESLVNNIELTKLYELTDFMNLMTYDMGGSFGISGLHASLYNSDLCQNKGGAHYVELYNAHGYLKDKIVYGAAFYGRGGDNVRGINQKYYGNEGLYFEYNDIVEMIASGKYKYVYDEKAKGGYLYDEYTFLSFDTPESIIAKIEYVKEQKLYGIMFWVYANDLTGSLLETIIKN